MESRADRVPKKLSAHARQLAAEMNLRMLLNFKWEAGEDILFVESVVITDFRRPVRRQAESKRRHRKISRINRQINKTNQTNQIRKKGSKWQLQNSLQAYRWISS